MKRWMGSALGGLGATLVVVALANSSRLAGPQASGGPTLLSHRGVHQVHAQKGTTADTCTARRIQPPRHDYIENTLPSIGAAFAAGADVVELDVHLTPDKQFAVFHDWTLDCRSDGQGVTEQQPLAYLRTLDVGYGYTPDGGRTFPLRGKGVGMMPTLPEVLQAFRGRQFLINFKSTRAEEGEALSTLLAQRPEWRSAVWGVYGGDIPTNRTRARTPDMRAYTGSSVKACFTSYILLGWTGYVPRSCHNTVMFLPANYAKFMWGWPHRFTQRLRSVGSVVILAGAREDGDGGASGIDTLEDLKAVPKGFDGHVWTNRIEVIGPELARSDRNSLGQGRDATRKPAVARSAESRGCVKTRARVFRQRRLFASHRGSVRDSA